jgi:hypothetical protein
VNPRCKEVSMAKWVNAPHFQRGGKAAIVRDGLGLGSGLNLPEWVFGKSISAGRLAGS